jgi:hypothetical protein
MQFGNADKEKFSLLASQSSATFTYSILFDQVNT